MAQGRTRLIIAAVVGVIAVAGIVIALAAGGGGDDKSNPGSTRVDCCAATRGGAVQRKCVQDVVLRIMDSKPTTDAGIAAAKAQMYRGSAALSSACHVIMHDVGLRWAGERKITLAKLQDVLPHDEDPGCAAGFAHGIVTYVAPSIDVKNPKKAADVCNGQGTRYLRYSCIHGLGHAFMRITVGALPNSIEYCMRLGKKLGVDCAQGAFHDYWFGVTGKAGAADAADKERDPRKLCGSQPPALVRPCWYRAFVELRSQDDKPPPASGADVSSRCVGLTGEQRSGCITGASVIGPSDPREQISICAELKGADVKSCVYGMKTSNLFDKSESLDVDVLKTCSELRGTDRTFCYEWLGQTLAVITDETFGKTGCPKAGNRAAVAACKRGAAKVEDPLIAFS
jgi:hypothetical protein